MSKVFVLDANKQPLNPVSPARARILLTKGEAAVYRSYPFTLILRQIIETAVPVPLRLKIDPGAKMTGLALVNDASGEVVWAAELAHRGFAVKAKLSARGAVRRSRRSRKTRYREPRWANRQRCAGWLPPSLMSRIANVLTWVKRLQRWCPLAALSLEVVKFDLQAMQNPEISGRAYQQGELLGYELREYLLHKWQRKCAYCGKKGVPLQIDHIVPRSKGGTDRVSNLTLACGRCNQAKGDQDVQAFLKRKPAVLERMLAQARTPLRDAAAVNTTRWLLYEQLQGLGLPVESGSGGRTKYNRSVRGLTKTHWLDAACIGASTPEELQTSHVIPLHITAYWHGCRQVCLMDEHGFPRTNPKRKPTTHTFRTGDQVRAVVPARLTHAGVHVGRMASKASGAFTITTAQGRVTDIGYRYCVLIQHRDGYGYLHGKGGRDFLPVP
jgi:5-methylcytosine-specific restriction endonuclease McrA